MEQTREPRGESLLALITTSPRNKNLIDLIAECWSHSPAPPPLSVKNHKLTEKQKDRFTRSLIDSWLYFKQKPRKNIAYTINFINYFWRVWFQSMNWHCVLRTPFCNNLKKSLYFFKWVYQSKHSFDIIIPKYGHDENNHFEICSQ